MEMLNGNGNENGKGNGAGNGVGWVHCRQGRLGTFSPVECENRYLDLEVDSRQTNFDKLIQNGKNNELKPDEYKIA